MRGLKRSPYPQVQDALTHELVSLIGDSERGERLPPSLIFTNSIKDNRVYRPILNGRRIAGSYCSAVFRDDSITLTFTSYSCARHLPPPGIERTRSA